MALTPEQLGKIVKKERKAMGLTQADLALTSGTGMRFISDLENGKPTFILDTGEQDRPPATRLPFAARVRIEERRRELVKLVSRRVEEGRIAVRNLRRDALQDLKEFEKEKMISEDDFFRGKDDVQDLTDEFIEKIDGIGKRKEEELMEI